MAKKQSAALIFPFKEDLQNRSLRRATSAEQNFNSAIGAFLVTEPMSRFGNPVGSIVPSLIHRLMPETDIVPIEEEIKKEISEQFPEITVLDTTLERYDEVSWILTIRYTSAITEIVDFQLLLQN